MKLYSLAIVLLLAGIILGGADHFLCQSRNHLCSALPGTTTDRCYVVSESFVQFYGMRDSKYFHVHWGKP